MDLISYINLKESVSRSGISIYSNSNVSGLLIRKGKRV